ncbi:MAG: chromosomal replication initiation protein DnaA [Clostridia bacterium]|nr:chromosomal replication initiation protein DnaA [Clostridia bacterium]
MQSNFMSIWSEALEILKEEISPVGYKTYVDVMIPRIADEHTICLLAPSNYHIDICKKRYLDLIQNTLQILTKRDYIITFESKEIIPEDNKYEKDLEQDTKEPLEIEFTKEKENENINMSSKSFITELNSNLNQKYTFDNYIIGSNNRFAHAAATAVSENPGQKYNPLYIYGGVGLGKTHLMQAIGNELIKTKPEMRIVYATGELFTNELVTALMTNKNEEFRKKYRNVDLLLIDDVQFLAGKDKCQEEFFHTFNTLFQSGKQIVLTSEKPPKEIMMLEERLKTRFEMGLSVDIQTPDYETRLAILRKKTQNERYIINDDVLVKIASKVKSNIRELEGVFNKLVAYSSFTNSDLTDSIVDNTIESILVKNTKVLTSKLIMQVVAKFFNIKVTDLTSEKRSNSVTYPRQIAMFLCREIANLSFPAIGRDFGGRDHSTVLHAYGKIKEEYDKNMETKNVIEELKKSLSIEE